MKNIHLLPTDNCSPLVHSTSRYGGLFLSKYYSPMKIMGDSYQNIYITNSEEIKKGWCYDKVLNLIFQTDNHTDFKYANQTDNVLKIILTTDQDLINDGIQAIDDEFLEWFVKNASCESVEVKIEYKDGYGNWFIYDKEFWDKHGNKPKFRTRYKIIIPQEEPKPHSFCETPEEKCTMNYCDENGCLNRKRELVEPKQETLEEAAERLYPISKGGSMWMPSKDDCNKANKQEGFIEGAKWQAERMYLHRQTNQFPVFAEILHDLITDIKLQGLIITDDIDLKKWFEQYKKK